MSGKSCPVHGCGALILADRLVCHCHWMLLPLDTRKQLAKVRHADPQDREAAERQAIDSLNGLNRRTRRFA